MTSTLKEKVIKAINDSKELELVKIEHQVQCDEVTAKINDKPIFLYIFPGRFSESVVIRITTLPMGCLEALYKPEALYTVYWGYDESTLRRSLEVKARAALSFYYSTRE